MNKIKPNNIGYKGFNVNSLKRKNVYLDKYTIYFYICLSFTIKETKFSKIQSTGLEPVKFTWKAMSLPLTYDCYNCIAVIE